MSTVSSSSSSLLRLEGRVAVITGGATGIGESIARLFRKHGAKVIILDVQDELGQQVCRSLGDETDACFRHCNVTSEDEVSKAIDFAVDRYGTVDIMVNNAGITGDKIPDIRDVDISEFSKVLELNINGVFIGMKHASRVMIPRKKGCIISLASVSSVLGGIGPHAYTASKHAVLGLTKSLAAELGKHGIRVNCISPYAVPTKLSMPHVPETERQEDALQGFLAFVRAHANLKGVDLFDDDVANAALYLASDESKYVSGLNLVVDGGFTSVNNLLRQFE